MSVSILTHLYKSFSLHDAKLYKNPQTNSFRGINSGIFHIYFQKLSIIIAVSLLALP